MTRNRDLKDLVRVRQKKTGETYSTALSHVRNARQGDAADINPPGKSVPCLDGGMATLTDPASQITEVHIPAAWNPTRIKVFHTPAEAKAARSRINERTALAVQDFVDLTGICEFARNHWVTCQLETETGICDQEFGNGWIMRRTDGAEGFIGKDCAQRHFGVHRRFAQERARAKIEVTVDDLVTRLEDHLTDPQLPTRIEKAFERQLALYKQVSDAGDAFPYPVLQRLKRIAKSRNRNIMLQFEYREKIEDRHGEVREISRWMPSIVGTVAAPGVLDTNRFGPIVKALHEASKTLTIAQADNRQQAAVLRSWCTTLEKVSRCEADLDQIAEGLLKFLEPASLRNLVWLLPSLPERLALTRVVLRLAGHHTATDDMARTAYETWRKEIVTPHQGRDFRVP